MSQQSWRGLPPTLEAPPSQSPCGREKEGERPRKALLGLRGGDQDLCSRPRRESGILRVHATPACEALSAATTPLTRGLVLRPDPRTSGLMLRGPAGHSTSGLQFLAFVSSGSGSGVPRSEFGDEAHDGRHQAQDPSSQLSESRLFSPVADTGLPAASGLVSQPLHLSFPCLQTWRLLLSPNVPSSKGGRSRCLPRSSS